VHVYKTSSFCGKKDDHDDDVKDGEDDDDPDNNNNDDDDDDDTDDDDNDLGQSTSLLLNFVTIVDYRNFSNTSLPLWKFQLSFIHFFKFFALPEPRKFQVPSVGGVIWILYGTTQCFSLGFHGQDLMVER